MPDTRRVTVVGAGLAGCEAAWQLAQRDIPVTLYDMKPVKYRDGFISHCNSNCLSGFIAALISAL